MIIRISGEGQYRIPDEQAAELNRLDARLNEAVVGGDRAAFTEAFSSVLSMVRRGDPVSMAEVVPSDAVLPPADADIDFVRELLTDEGLIPG